MSVRRMNISLDEGRYEELRQVAFAKKTSMSKLIRNAIDLLLSQKVANAKTPVPSSPTAVKVKEDFKLVGTKRGELDGDNYF